MGAFLLANKALLPEMIIFLMSLIVLMSAVFLPQSKRDITLLGMTLLTLFFATFASIWGVPESTQWLMHKMVVVDHLGTVLKISSYLIGACLCAYAYRSLHEMKMPVGEFYVLTLLSLLGLSVLVSAGNFMTLFVGLELMSLPLYAMIAMRRQSILALEAALKYFVIGAIATGILLYGISLLYGATQSLSFLEISSAMQGSFASHHLLMTFSLAFIMMGLGFKLGLVPCHMWLPDVYEGAPTIMTMFVATLAKIGAVGMLMRVLLLAMPALMPEWQPLLMVLIMLSLFLGNVTAVRQTNLKRLLAYSSIAQFGTILLGVLTGTTFGNSATLFYLVSYGITTLAAFALLMCFRREDGSEAVLISDYSGLFKHHPWYAVMFAIVMFSLAGVPPFLGFIAKFQVFQALMQAGSLGILIYTLLMTVVAAYYYIAVIKVMFFDENTVPLQRISLGLASTVLSLNVVAVLLLGIFPSALLTCINMFVV